MKIGTNITTIRNHFGLSQSEFANKLGVSKAIVSLWENEKKYPSRKNVENLVQTFRIDPKDLFESNIKERLSQQPLFKFHTSSHTIKDGVELKISTEKLSKEDLDNIEKAVGILKVLFST